MLENLKNIIMEGLNSIGKFLNQNPTEEEKAKVRKVGALKEIPHKDEWKTKRPKRKKLETYKYAKGASNTDVRIFNHPRR